MLPKQKTKVNKFRKSRFKNALKKNVKALCYDCKFSNKGIEINNKIKILLNDR